VAAAVVLAVALHGAGPSPSVAVSEPTPTSTPTAATPVPAPSQPPPGARTTQGRADVDGDGRVDEVTVAAATGVVSLALAGGPTLQARLPFTDASNTLQAIADLWDTGTKQILIYSSASGCCGDHPNESQSLVVALVGQSLRVVQDASKPLRLAFSDGRGDVYASIECRSGSHAVIQTTFDQLGPRDATRTVRAIALSGSTATDSLPTTSHLQGRYPQDLEPFAVARGCVGLASNGTSAP
jgi:hypothetical protein